MIRSHNMTASSRRNGVRSSRPAAGGDAGVFTRWALYLWFFSLPYDAFPLPGLPAELQGKLSIPRIAGIVLLAAFLIDRRVRPWRLPPGSKAFGLFFLVFTCSMLRSGFEAVGAVLQQFQMIAAFFVCYNLFLTRRPIQGALFSFVVSCGLSAALTLAGFVDVQNLIVSGGRLSAVGWNANEYSEILAVGVLACIGLAHVRNTKSFLGIPILWGIILICLAAMVDAGSRGMTLALGVGVAVLVWPKSSAGGRLRRVALLFLIGGATFWMFRHAEVLASRWTELIERGATSGRGPIFIEATKMAVEKPLLGWGAEAPRQLAMRLDYWGEVRAAHNLVLAMLIHAGMLGAVPYFWGYWMVFRASWRSRKGTEGLLPLAIFVGMFIGDSISGGLPLKVQWTFFAYHLAAGGLAKCVAWPREGRARGKPVNNPSPLCLEPLAVAAEFPVVPRNKKGLVHDR